MSAYTTLAVALAATLFVGAGSLAADAKTERSSAAAKVPPRASGGASDQRTRPSFVPQAPVHWDALDPKTIERAERRRSIQVPSFPPERQ